MSDVTFVKRKPDLRMRDHESPEVHEAAQTDFVRVSLVDLLETLAEAIDLAIVQPPAFGCDAS